MAGLFCTDSSSAISDKEYVDEQQIWKNQKGVNYINFNVKDTYSTYLLHMWQG